MTNEINIHAKLFLVETQDFTAVVSYGAEEFSKSLIGALVLACESLDIDPDNYPVPHKDWIVTTIGSPVVGFMRNRVVLATRK